MSKVRFIADLHFGHSGVIKNQRKFQDEFYHDQLIQDNWNQIVHKKDTIYILGDITMESSKDYYKLSLLNGRKIVCLGNHDRWQDVPELLKYVDGVFGIMDYSCKYLKDKGIRRAWLSHCPIHRQEVFPGEINIHGHLHDKIVRRKETVGKNGGSREVADKDYICVSVDQTNFMPKTIEQLI